MVFKKNNKENKVEKNNKPSMLYKAFKKKNVNNRDLLENKTINLTTSSISEESILSKQKKIPFLDKLSINSQYKVLGIVAFVSFCGIILSGVQYGAKINNEANIMQTSTSLAADVNQIEYLFGKSLDRDLSSYNNLIALSNKILNQFQYLQTITNNNTSVFNIYQSIAGNLTEINNNISLLNTQPNLMLNEIDLSEQLNAKISKINSSIRNFGLEYGKNPLTNNDISNIYFLRDSIHEINILLTNILLSEDISLSDVEKLRKSQGDFLNILNIIRVGDAAKNIPALYSYKDSNLSSLYNIIENEWKIVSNDITNIYNIYTNPITEKLLIKKTNTSIGNIVNNINYLTELYKNEDLSGVSNSKYLFFICLLLLLVSIYMILLAYFYNTYNRSLIEKLEYSKNQNSIFKLLSEMMPLQDGDLTKKTTVTEEITGAIADSINATIDSLVSLVKKIKDTSLVMGDKTKEVNDIAKKMLTIAEQQTNSLNEANKTVSEITNAINDISKKTEESVKEAKKSVEISELGSKQVDSSVLAMQEINKNMEETVVLMKKVDYSSKQISEIVELLSDITEQTSILALNATVQATRAGEKGKGFKIVADSVQELADKASEATRRVGALISAVQNDIKAVDNAINKTTQEVDKGVRLSESAGDSLKQTTDASKDLSKLIDKVSKDARTYANYARNVNENMKDLLLITEENKNSSVKTVSAVEEISEISKELRDSVHSFKIGDN